MKGYVSNIQKFSVHDGYGIRTIVFLLGCTLSCKWCQNPETLCMKPQLMFVETLCKRCGRCKSACPDGGPQLLENGHLIYHTETCADILACEDICPYEALKVSGKEMTAEQVAKEVLKDKVFYKNSGGGLTISGGEPLLQIDFTSEILKLVKREDIATCIETAGHVPWSNIERILPLVDLVLYDFKILDSALHEEWTGADNQLILSNLKKLSKQKKEIIIRVPLIPTINDGQEFKDIVEHVLTMDSIKELHILPFHQLGNSKYDHLNMRYAMGDWREENQAMIIECQDYAERNGLRVSVGGSGF